MTKNKRGETCLRFLYARYFLSFFVILFVRITFAHPLDVIYFQINSELDSKFTTCLNINPDTLKQVTNLTNLTQENLNNFQLFTLKSNGRSCHAELTEAKFLSDDVKLCHLLKCEKMAEQNYRLSFNILDQVGPLFSIIGQFTDAHESYAFTVSQKNNEYSLTAKKMNFFTLGIEHIGATIASWQSQEGKFQLPDGLDHVLFILVLLLSCSSWKSLFINISGFTLGHSISLGISLAKIVVFPAKYVELAIAGSIAYMAFKTFKGRERESHLVLTIFFGFIHGMGFSYALDGLDLGTASEFFKVLFLFNVGIEVGQILIILALLPIYILKQRSKLLGQNLRRIIGISVFCVSLYWFYERALSVF